MGEYEMEDPKTEDQVYLFLIKKLNKQTLFE
jgi:hypothetical protein